MGKFMGMDVPENGVQRGKFDAPDSDVVQSESVASLSPSSPSSPSQTKI
jgi:hypothetical protein